MRIGDLTKRVAIMRATTTVGETGQTIKTYSVLATRWASVEIKSSTDEKNETINKSKTIANFVFRFGVDLTSADRLVWGSKTFSPLGEPIEDKSGYFVSVDALEV